MLAYIIRRLFYAIPILIGVNLLTFTLFFVVNSPDDMAVSQLGEKYVTPEAIAVGRYRLVFEAGAYLMAQHGMAEEDLFLTSVPLDFRVFDAAQKYHVPLLLSPYGYSTYRGS